MRSFLSVPFYLFGRLALMLACVIAGFATLGLCLRYRAVVFILAAALAWRRMRGWGGSSKYAHGTARVCSLGDLARAGMLSGNGLILGRPGLAERPTRRQAVAGLFNPRLKSRLAMLIFLAAFFNAAWADAQMIRVNDYTHLVTFAPTGKGKGVSVILPNLLSYRGSVVATDPKAELFKLTARHRQRKLGHRIVRLDPFGMAGQGGDCFNPLQFIDPAADDFLDQCRDLSNMMIVRTGRENDPHWNDSAELVLTSFIAFVAGCEGDPADRNLKTVRHIIVSRDRYERAMAAMQASGDACQGVIAQLGHMLTWFKDKELSSVLSSVQRQTSWMDSPAVIKHLCSSTFDPRQLRTGRMSVYFCVPSDRLATLGSPLMRLWIGSTLRITARGADERNPVLFLLDEAGHLGKVQALEDAITLMRGMGIRLWFFFQSLHQLNECYGEKATVFLDNFDTQQYFGTNAYQTAVAISDRIGTATITSQSYARGTSFSHSAGGEGGRAPQPGQRGSNSTLTTSEMGRKLLLPEEILGLDPDIALIFHKHLPVIPARLLKHYNAPEFRRGGTGRQRGLGLSALLVAAATLLASAGFASLAGRFPRQLPTQGGFALPSLHRWFGTWSRPAAAKGRYPSGTHYDVMPDPRTRGRR